MRDLYEPNAYFERFESLYLAGDFTFGRPRARYLQRHPWARFKARAVELARCAVLCWRLIRQIPQPQLRREYRRRLWRLLRTSDRSVGAFCLFLEVRSPLSSLSDGRTDGRG